MAFQQSQLTDLGPYLITVEVFHLPNIIIILLKVQSDTLKMNYWAPVADRKKISELIVSLK